MTEPRVSAPSSDIPEFDSAFLREVRRQRILRNWTQAELASRTGGAMNTSTLAGYESGHRKLRLESAVIIAAALGVRFSALVEIVERAVVDGDTVLLDGERIIASSDLRLEPVRRWLRAARPTRLGTSEGVPLSTPALHALFEVMGISTVDGHRLLDPYLESITSFATGTTRAGAPVVVTHPDRGAIPTTDRSTAG